MAAMIEEKLRREIVALRQEIAALELALAGKTARRREIMIALWAGGAGLSWANIAEPFDISRERVGQIIHGRAGKRPTSS